jgi:hypothetical protein
MFGMMPALTGRRQVEHQAARYSFAPLSWRLSKVSISTSGVQDQTDQGGGAPSAGLPHPDPSAGCCATTISCVSRAPDEPDTVRSRH